MTATRRAGRGSAATKRPWHVFEGGNFVMVVASGFEEQLKKSHYLGGSAQVCELNDKSRRKALANARLIVAAVNEFKRRRQRARRPA